MSLEALAFCHFGDRQSLDSERPRSLGRSLIVADLILRLNLELWHTSKDEQLRLHPRVRIYAALTAVPYFDAHCC